MGTRKEDMKKSRKIIVYIATSADGFIARPDGSYDWLNRPHPKGDYGMPGFFRSIDTILWGRKTWMQGLAMKVSMSIFGADKKHYVFTRSADIAANPANKPASLDVKFVNEPIKAFARTLRAKAGKDIWMMGGGDVIASFLDAGEIDEFSIHVIPVMIGEGIPLVAPRHRSVELKLLSSKRFSDGVVHLNYSVKR
jgi:dihydrofolate reductase